MIHKANGNSKLRLTSSALLALMVAFGLAACSGSGNGGGGHSTRQGAASKGSSGSTAAPKRGGSVTTLVSTSTSGQGVWAAGLDPATSVGENATQEQAIYGGLFLMRANADGTNAQIVPNQAESATFSTDLKTVTIKLRSGLKFSDGTPFNAQAVIWNFKRAFDPKVSGSVPLWDIRKTDPFTSPDPLTVVIHLAQPDVTLLHDFPQARTNWIASPSAYAKMGEKQFRVTPVGAGPFVVVSDQLSSLLILKRNPLFFKADQGLPYLDKLTFKSVGGEDQSVYQALLAGNGDTSSDLSTPAVLKQAESSSKLTLTIQPNPGPISVLFNTMAPPFNNIKAREAVFYATNWKAISDGLLNGDSPVVESFTAPGGLFYHQKVPGYRTYDLTKAKQLVKELGGLRIQAFAGTTAIDRGVMTALQTQWKQAGMHVDLQFEELAQELAGYKSGKWQAGLVRIGSWDPASGLGLNAWFNSHSPYTGTKDTQLDKLLQQSVTTGDNDKRDQIYQEIAKYVSDHALAAFGLAIPYANLTVKGVQGPGLTTKLPVGLGIYPIWSEVWRQQ